MRSSRLSLAAGIALVAFGSTVLAGWLRHDPGLIRLFFDRDGMPFASAIGFIVAGLALVSANLCRSRADALTPAFLPDFFGIVLVLLGAAALVGWMGGPGLGLATDPAVTIAWFDDPNPVSGRMRPLAALGFVALGLDLWMIRRPAFRPGAWISPFLTLFILVAGILGLTGPFTSLGPVYSWALGPVFSAGLGFVVAGAGLLLLRSGPVHEQATEGDESQRIILLAGAIVVVTGLVGILGGFSVLYPGLIRELEENLTVSLNHRSDTLQGAIRAAWQETSLYAQQPLRVVALDRISRHQGSAADRDMLRNVLAHAPEFGFSAARFLDRKGRTVAETGSFTEHPDLAVPLRLPSSSSLLWNEGYRLRIAIEIRKGGRLAGFLEAERPLPARLAELQGANGVGRTVEFPVCAPTARGLDCFPFPSTAGKVLHDLPFTWNGRPVPLSYAAQGHSGIVRTTDYRGVPVIAAYAPVGDLGLVAGFKIDAAEFYQPVAERLWALFLLLLMVAAGAILLLHLQVLPLVRKMRREIDERKRAEERLQQSEARLTEITATLGEGVYVLDAHGAVTFVNPEAERLLGWSAAEMLGRDAHALFHFQRPDGTPIHEHYCPVHQSYRNGVTYRSNDEWFVRKDGSFVPVALISSPILRNGRVEGSVASFVDVSEQKRISEELNRHRDHLEQMVEERTSELRKLNHELEAFSYSVSHDLRAPLRAINGYGGALREDYGNLVPAEAHVYLDRMQAATVRMGELVDGLLNLSQVIRSEPDRVEVDLSGLAVSIAASLHEAEPRRRVTFDIEPGVMSTGDPALLRVLLENLFVNAWKFTAKRTEGRIEFGRKTLAGETAFYVRDNGVGFDMQFAHKLFQPFERLHKHGEFAGNGIGLATVRRIVERHGGRVWAASGLDEGTTIWFMLGKLE